MRVDRIFKKPVHEITLIDTYTICIICDKHFPTQLREMGGGKVRDQPRCSQCRNIKRSKKEASING